MTLPIVLLQRLAAAKSRAMKQSRELVEESMSAATRKRLEAKQRKTVEEIKDLRKQIKDQTPPDEFPPEGFSEGGRVIGPGLSGLLRGFTQGPLARVSRETQEPVGMFRGGGMGRFVPELDFSNVKIDPTQLPAYVAPAAAAETLAAQQAVATPTTPATRDLIAQQRALEQAQAMGALATAPGQTPNEPGMFLREGTDVLLSPNVITNYQGRGGTRPTDPVATDPVATDPVATDPVAADPVAADPVATDPVTTTDPVATTPVATTPVATTPVATTPVASEPVQTVATDPVYLPPVETTPVVAGPSAAEILAAEQAAADALAAQEAEQIRIAQEEAARVAAEQEAIRVANEQAAAELLAQQETARIAQEQAAAQEAEQLAAELLAAQEAEKQLEAERLAAAQLAAEQLAAQQAAQLAADQEAAAQLQAAEQLAAQQEADRLAMEAQLAATPDPDPIYDAPTQGELLQAAETAQAATEDLFTTPTDTATAIDRGAYGQVFDPVGGGIGSLQSALDRINLTVPDPVENFAFGYPTSQGMEIQRTYMPFEGTEEERATGYTMPIYKPVAQQTMPSLFRTTETGDVDPDAFTAGSAAPGPGSGTINTGTQGTAPGTYGLEPTQMYQCPNGYVLSFVNGNPICNLVGGGGPGKKRQVPPEVIDIAGGMRYGGEVGLSRGIGSFGA